MESKTARKYTKDDVCHQKLRDYVPDFKGMGENLDDVDVVALSGLTNYIFRVSRKSNSKSVLYRIFGSQDMPLLDRNRENYVLNKLSSLGLAPKIFYADQDIRIEEWLDAEPIEGESKTKRKMLLYVADFMASFHYVFQGDQSPTLSQPKTTIQMILEDRCIIKELEKKPQSKHKVIADKINEFFSKYASKEELEWLHKAYDKLVPIEDRFAMCHNDLHWGNVLHVKGTKIYFTIDFEYAHINPASYDIANFFVEWAFGYDLKEPPHFSCDLKKFPTEKQMEEFLIYYVMARDKHKVKECETYEEYIEEVKKLHVYEEVMAEIQKIKKQLNFMAMFSNYFWCLVLMLTFNEPDGALGYEKYWNARMECYEYFKEKVKKELKE